MYASCRLNGVARESHRVQYPYTKSFFVEIYLLGEIYLFGELA